MRRLAAIVLVAAVTSFVVGGAACTDLEGLAGGSEGARPGVDDAGRDNPCAKDLDADHDNCGACGTVCGGMEHCLAGRCAPGCPDHVVYVSSGGNDDASGCTTTTPKRTIGAAIALLKTLSAEKHEVHVCRGQYDETVRLDHRASILGAYECSTWRRSAGYGAPSFDSVNETVVRGTASSPPLEISKVDGVIVDGLTLRGGDNAAAPSVGALVKDGARATLSNVKAFGAGGTPANSPGSVGVMVDGNAFAEVTRSVVEGGTGPLASAGGYGSAGIFLASKAGGVHVADSRVNGGSGKVSGGTGSVGILALGASLASTIERSSVDGGLGHTTVGSATYGIGFFSGAGAADVSILDSVVDGGAGGCASTCNVTGVSVNAAGNVRVTGNRIYGGEGKPDLAEKISFFGLRLTDFANADVQNNSIFTGNAGGRLSGGAEAVSLTRGGAALVANNTLALGSSPTTPGSLVVATSKTATVANNLLLNAFTTTPGAAVELDACTGQTYAIQNNAWVGFQQGAELLAVKRVVTMTCTRASDTTVDALETSARAAFGAANVGGNRRLSDACTADSQCTPSATCTTGPKCIPLVLTAWEPSTAGDLFGAGWRLGSATPCTITKGGLPLPGLLATDAFGNARTDPRSMGAHEHDGACQ